MLSDVDDSAERGDHVDVDSGLTNKVPFVGDVVLERHWDYFK